MVSNAFIDRLNSGKTLVSDGATGTNLQARGLSLGMPGELWVFEKPEEIIRLHKDFITAGSDIILTCTFGGSRIRLAQKDMQNRTAELNKTAVQLARTAVEGTNVLVAGSIGPLGQLLKPLGTIEPEDARQAYTEQAGLLAEAGVDLLLIETQYDIEEARIALEGAQSVSSLPIVLSFSYDRGTRTMMGVKPTQMAEAFSGMNVTALGINCGKSLENNLEALRQLRSVTGLPIWFKPNAGLPKLDASGTPVYDVNPEEMGQQVSQWVEAGANIVGGCCGTSPEHLHQIALAAHSS